MTIHFEELWVKCEDFFKESNSSTQSVLEELTLKCNLYKVIDSRTEIPEEERQKIKSRTMGEILLTLTCLSLKDNVNVFEALNTALQYRNIEHYSKKHPVA
jgi:hypothetical protein